MTQIILPEKQINILVSRFFSLEEYPELRRCVEVISAYQTIRNTAEGAYAESGSKFLAFAYPIQSEEEIKPIREMLQKAHHKAVHVVWAARIGFDGAEERSSDDGEPSGSAGKPVLNALRSKALTNVAVFVVRYFGGKKLGIPGLIHAYRAATLDCLTRASIVTEQIMDHYTVRCAMDAMQVVLHEINKAGARVDTSEFGEYCTFKITIARVHHDKINQLRNTLWQAEFTGPVAL